MHWEDRKLYSERRTDDFHHTGFALCLFFWSFCPCGPWTFHRIVSSFRWRRSRPEDVCFQTFCAFRKDRWECGAEDKLQRVLSDFTRDFQSAPVGDTCHKICWHGGKKRIRKFVRGTAPTWPDLGRSESNKFEFLSQIWWTDYLPDCKRVLPLANGKKLGTGNWSESEKITK